MDSRTRTRLNAFVLPLALLLALQGGSCRNDGRGGRNDTTNRNDTAAVNRNANANANTNAGSTNAGRTNAAQTNARPSPTQETPRVDDAGGTARTAPAGEWGTRGAELNVTPAGAEIEFDCAHGTIDEPLRLDLSGRFDAAGTFSRERGGPVRIDEKPDSHPARYRGRVEGQTMTLTVTLTETKEDIVTLTLTRGQPPRLTKCL